MDGNVDIVYAGVVVGRGVAAEVNGSEALAFVSLADPLPVGTPIEVATASGRRPARVERVVEEGSPGIQLRYLDVVEAPVVMLFAPAAQRPSSAPPPLSYRALTPPPPAPSAMPARASGAVAVVAAPAASGAVVAPMPASTSGAVGSSRKSTLMPAEPATAAQMAAEESPVPIETRDRDTGGIPQAVASEVSSGSDDVPVGRKTAAYGIPVAAEMIQAAADDGRKKKKKRR